MIKVFWQKFGHRSFANYLIIGVINTLFGFTLIFVLHTLGVVAELANFFGYFFGIMLSFYLNRTYNFKSKGNFWKEYLQFLSSMAFSYVLNLVALSILYRLGRLPFFISQLLASGVYVISGYLLSRYWVFSQKREKTN
ncbi:MAG: GtrA family protein [Leptospiraceae bacterium]|nr:GtrA family protein [Leptospiraceae bacterium]MDW8307481.1 GtrA family protein [Leptospiraceae bacterium]